MPGLLFAVVIALIVFLATGSLLWALVVFLLVALLAPPVRSRWW